MDTRDIIKIILTVIFVIVSIALSAIVLLQEGKDAGLSGAISGAADTYFGKNKGRTMEGKLELGTRIIAISFFVIAIILNVIG